MGRTRVFKWNLFFGFLLVVVNIVNGIILVPLYLEYIDPALYGLWLASGNVLAWLSLIDPGVGGVLLQQVGVAFGRRDLIEVSHLIGAGLIISIIITFLFGAVGYLFVIELPLVLNIGQTYYEQSDLHEAFLFALIGTMLMIGSFSITSILQALQISVSIGVLFILNMVASILIVLILLQSGLGLKAIGLSMFFRGVIQFVGSLVLLIRHLRVLGINNFLDLFSKAHFLKVFHLSSFNFLGKASATLHGQVQLFFIARYMGPLNVTVYKFTQSGPELSKQFVMRPIQAFIPSFLNLLGEKGSLAAKPILIRILNYFVWIMGLIFIGCLMLNSSFVSQWVGREFYGGSLLNALICLALAVSLMLDLLSHLVFALGDVRRNNVIQIIQLAIFLLLAYWGISLYGLVGMVGAYILSHFISICYYPYALAKMVSLTLADLRPLLYDLSLICLLAVASYLLIDLSNLSLRNLLLYGVLICLIYGVFLGMVSRNFRHEIGLAWKKFR